MSEIEVAAPKECFAYEVPVVISQENASPTKQS
jgi:hypothetical protein